MASLRQVHSSRDQMEIEVGRFYTVDSKSNEVRKIDCLVNGVPSADAKLISPPDGKRVIVIQYKEGSESIMDSFLEIYKTMAN